MITLGDILHELVEHIPFNPAHKASLHEAVEEAVGAVEEDGPPPLPKQDA